jgi:hypothetical protein
MRRTNHVGQTILGWALGLGLLLVVAFTVVEFAIGTRPYAEGDWDPSITHTTISDFESDNDPPLTGIPLAKP